MSRPTGPASVGSLLPAAARAAGVPAPAPGAAGSAPAAKGARPAPKRARGRRPTSAEERAARTRQREAREAAAEKARQKRAALAGRASPRVGDGFTFRPEEVCSPAHAHALDFEAARVEGLAAPGWKRAELEALREAHPRLAHLSPCAVALLCVLEVFRRPSDGGPAAGWASLGVQLPVRAWCWLLGYAERTVQLAFADLAEAGLCARYEDRRTLTHLTQGRPPDEQLDAWRDSRGKVHDYANTYSVTYLTPAGAALVERAGFELAAPDLHGRRRQVLAGFRLHVLQELGPLARKVCRRVRATAGLWTTAATPPARAEMRAPVGVAAQLRCTPPDLQASRGLSRVVVGTGCGELPTREGAEPPPTGAAEAGDARAKLGAVAALAQLPRAVGAPAGRAVMGGSVPESDAARPLEATDAQLAAFHGLTAAGFRDGLSWEGGGLVVFAETVARCWARAVRFLEDAPHGQAEPSGGHGAAGASSTRHKEREWRPWRCLGCGAPRPRWEGREGGRGRVHGARCPLHGAALPAAVDFVWVPALTVEVAYARALRLRPEDGPKLAAIFAPVQRELMRRLAAHWPHEEAAPAAPAAGAARPAAPLPQPGQTLAGALAARRAELEQLGALPPEVGE